MTESTTLQLSEKLDQLRLEIDSALDDYTRFPGDCPAELASAIRYSLLAPGKRLRPLLTLLAAEATSGSSQEAMPAACAVEMIHAYSLIHDDLPAMDDDDLRRGRPTCHKAFGEALAILAGDGLLTLALEIIARAMRPAEVAMQCTAELAKAAGVLGMVGGQADDIQTESTAGDAAGDIEDLVNIHRRKTGAMFVASLRLGGIAARASDEQLTALTVYGQKIGLAFQITDDLLDVSGDEATVGKKLSKDSEQGKLTFPGLLGIDSSRQRAAQLIDEAIAQLTVFHSQAGCLEALARYVLERNH